MPYQRRRLRCRRSRLVTMMATNRSKLTAPRAIQNVSYGEANGMTDEVSGMSTYPSATAVSTCSAMKATDSSEMFRCRPVSANRGSPGSRPCRLISRPSSATAVNSSSATTPVERLAYHIQVEELFALTSYRLAEQPEAAISDGYDLVLSALAAGRAPRPLSPSFTNGVPP